jgi:hypothetical protein
LRQFGMAVFANFRHNVNSLHTVFYTNLTHLSIAGHVMP